MGHITHYFGALVVVFSTFVEQNQDSVFQIFSPLLWSKFKIRFFKVLLHFCGVNSRFGFPKFRSTFVALFWERNSIVLSLKVKVHRHEKQKLFSMSQGSFLMLSKFSDFQHLSDFHTFLWYRWYALIYFYLFKKSPIISSNILARRTIPGYT